MTSPSRHLAGNHQPEQNHHDHTDRDESALHARRQQGDQGMHHMIGRGLVVGMDSVTWGALELELTDGHVSDRLTLALNKEHQRRMEYPLQGRRVDLESARRDLDRDAVIAADQGDGFAAGSAVANEVWGRFDHEPNLIFLAQIGHVNACVAAQPKFSEVA